MRSTSNQDYPWLRKSIIIVRVPVFSFYLKTKGWSLHACLTAFRYSSKLKLLDFSFIFQFSYFPILWRSSRPLVLRYTSSMQLAAFIDTCHYWRAIRWVPSAPDEPLKEPVSRQFRDVDEDLGKVDEPFGHRSSLGRFFAQVSGHTRSSSADRAPTAGEKFQLSRGDLIKFGGHGNHDATTTDASRSITVMRIITYAPSDAGNARAAILPIMTRPY